MAAQWKIQAHRQHFDPLTTPPGPNQHPRRLDLTSEDSAIRLAEQRDDEGT